MAFYIYNIQLAWPIRSLGDNLNQILLNLIHRTDHSQTGEKFTNIKETLLKTLSLKMAERIFDSFVLLLITILLQAFTTVTVATVTSENLGTN